MIHDSSSLSFLAEVVASVDKCSVDCCVVDTLVDRLVVDVYAVVVETEIKTIPLEKKNFLN